MSPTDLPRPVLEIGRIYSDDELASLFGFQPHYLRSAGGMIPAPRLNALILVTHAGNDASFAYGDYWEGDRLCYAGRGQRGDQVFDGSNRDVAENSRELWLFEYVQAFRRRFLGNPTCRAYWWEMSRDREQKYRRALRFRLEFDATVPPPTAAVSRNTRARRLSSVPFDENWQPPVPAPGEASSTPEQRAELLEKRNSDHRRLLVTLKRDLDRSGWTHIEEMRSAIDLWAQRGGHRTIFEAKTLNLGNELGQVRSALSQLLEYRFFYGAPDDSLCLVVDAPVSDRRVRFLDATGIGVLVFDGARFMACGVRADGILSGEAHQTAGTRLF